MRSAADFASELLAVVGDAHVTNAKVVRDLCIREIEAGTEKPYGAAAWSLIDAERQRQDAKWGEQNHDPQVWSVILGEEYGEMCQAANDLRWPKPEADAPLSRLMTEAVQTAAVAKAVVECLLRGKWGWPPPPPPPPKHDPGAHCVIADGKGCVLAVHPRPETRSHDVYMTHAGGRFVFEASGEACEALISALGTTFGKLTVERAEGGAQ